MSNNNDSNFNKDFNDIEKTEINPEINKNINELDKTELDKTEIDKTQKYSKDTANLINLNPLKLDYFLDSYKIEKELEIKGAEADYYLISDKNNNQYFLKLYRKGFKPKLEILKRVQELYQEFPQYFINIISYGYDKNTQRYYEIQEYIKHGNLLEFYKNKDITIDDLKLILKHINEALNVLHKKNIIHRDIKPQNILVRKDNPIELLLTDFGISSLNEEDVSKIITTHFKGTIAYSAPETFSNYFGKEIDYWALGMVLLEIIQKRHPFENLSQQVIMNQIFTKGVLISDNIDEKIRKLLRNLLNRDYSRRWGYEEVNKWINDEEVIDYVEEDIEQYKKVKIEDWLREGFTEKSAREWMKVIDDPKIAIIFKEEGFSVSEAKEWIEAGMKSGELASNWKNAGFNLKDAVFFEDNGLVLKKVLYFTNDLKIQLEDLKTYLEMKLDVNKIEEIINKKISLKEYVVFYDVGVKELDEIIELKEFIKEGFNIEEAEAWKENGFNLEEAVEWKINKFNSTEAKEWRENGFNPTEAKDWKIIVFNSNQAIEWKKNGFKLNEAKFFKNKGIDLKTAKQKIFTRLLIKLQSFLKDNFFK